jgi:hypothetical protein
MEKKVFEVLSIADMRNKYYWPDEQPPVVPIAFEKVPEQLRPLIPLAERWGISDDMLRSDARCKALPEEIAYLKEAIRRFDNELDHWLAGPEASSATPSQEYLAFSNMRMAAAGC